MTQPWSAGSVSCGTVTVAQLPCHHTRHNYSPSATLPPLGVDEGRRSYVRLGRDREEQRSAQDLTPLRGRKIQPGAPGFPCYGEEGAGPGGGRRAERDVGVRALGLEGKGWRGAGGMQCLLLTRDVPYLVDRANTISEWITERDWEEGGNGMR